MNTTNTAIMLFVVLAGAFGGADYRLFWLGIAVGFVVAKWRRG